MKKLDKYLTKILSLICIVIMGVLTVFVFASVILRYVFSITYIWAEELITFLFLGTTYFGVALGVRENEHIAIDLLKEKLNIKSKIVLEMLNILLVIYVQVVVFRASLEWIGKIGNVLSAGLRIPIMYIYYMMPISCILVIIYEIMKMVTIIQKNIFLVKKNKVVMKSVEEKTEEDLRLSKV